jgi:hypothetical protein
MKIKNLFLIAVMFFAVAACQNSEAPAPQTSFPAGSFGNLVEVQNYKNWEADLIDGTILRLEFGNGKIKSFKNGEFSVEYTYQFVSENAFKINNSTFNVTAWFITSTGNIEATLNMNDSDINEDNLVLFFRDRRYFKK